MKEAHWRGHVEAQRSSGVSVRGYCAEHGLRESGFYWWKRRLREREARGAAPPEQPERVAFAEVVVREAPPVAPACEERFDSPWDAGVAVEFPCGARMHLARGFDAEAFARAAVALLEAGRC